MIIWASMLLPLITIISLILFFRCKIVWWEYLLVLGIPALTILGIKLGVEASQVSCTEYWGGYLTKAAYYEKWDEYIHQTCSRQYACGTDSEGNTRYCTEFYDCSYVAHHPEYWETNNSLGETFSIDRSYFEHLCKLWGSRTFTDMKRNFHSYDGDAYLTAYDQNRDHLIGTTTKHHYENRVQASHSIFNFREFKKGEAGALGLYDHPNVGNFFQPCMLGPWSAEDRAKGEKAVGYVNAVLGRPSKVRVYVLLWVDKTLQVSHEQEAYWKGGNKNELVICAGMSSATPGKVEWARVFGWTKNEELKIQVRDYMLANKVLDVTGLGQLLETSISGKVVRRDFREFAYLTVDPPKSAVIWTLVVTFLLCLGLAWFVIVNEINQEKGE
jgi:hypothetical protein